MAEQKRSEFLQWPKIGKLSDVAYHARKQGISKVKYNAKIKLHGTNAGIRIDKPDYAPAEGLAEGCDALVRVTAQSRSRDLGPGKDDNFGFYEFCKQHNLSLRPFRMYGVEAELALFGEWYGSNVQNGVALAQIPEKHFALFAAVLDRDYVVYEPESLKALAGTLPCHVLPWFFEQDIEIDFEAPSQELVEMINSKVEAIDGLCPYARDVHGVTGPGEGLVFYPRLEDDSPGAYARFGGFSFKAKGESHRVNGGRAADIKPLASEDVIAFAKQYVTTARCEQALSELRIARGDLPQTSAFVKWVVGDVLSETVVERETSGIDAKAVSKTAGRLAAEWFKS